MKMAGAGTWGGAGWGGVCASEHSMLVCVHARALGADSRCSEEGGLGPCS